MTLRQTLACVGLYCALGVFSTGLAAAKDLPAFLYSHPPGDIRVAFPVALKNGQEFTIQIIDTCPEQFTYQIHGVVTPPEPPDESRKALRRLTSATIKSVYYSQFGAYELRIRERENPTYCQQGGTEVKHLRNVTLTITFQTTMWEIGGEAAMTFIPGTLKKWIVDPTSSKVARDSDHESAGRFNFATLTHLYPPGWKGVGPVVGFGLVDNDPEYYFGVGVGLGPENKRHLNLTAGFAFTKRNVLPAGVTEGKPVPDPKVLDSLPVQRTFRPFVALTATFFRTSGSDTKPTAPAPVN